MSKVLISVGVYQLISSVFEEVDELLPPQAAKTAVETKATAPRPTRFHVLPFSDM